MSDQSPQDAGFWNPYFAGFMKLVEDGVDFTRIDKAMEKWGWPMGPD